MPRQKLLILGIGAVVLLALSTMLFFLDGEQQIIQSDNVSNNTADSDMEETGAENTAETNPEQNSAGDSINIGSEENNSTESLDTDTEEELRERAQNTIDQYFPSENDPFSRDAFEEHALASLHYQQQDEEGTLEEETIASNAEWIAIELNGWSTYAQEEYDFSFSDDSFQSYIEEEQQNPLGNNAEVRILMEEMEAESSVVAEQHLQYQFANSYIWHEIQEDAADSAGVEPQSVEQWNQLYFAVEQEVFEKISEDHPEFSEGEPE